MLLLVVLALLAIFALVGVAFVVLTSQAQRSAKSIERIDQGDRSVATGRGAEAVAAGHHASPSRPGLDARQSQSRFRHGRP